MQGDADRQSPGRVERSHENEEESAYRATAANITKWLWEFGDIVDVPYAWEAAN